jgi:hypothetical protein
MQIAKNLQQSTMSSKSALTSPNKVKKSTSKASGYRLSNKPLSFMNNNTIQQQFLLQQQQQQQQKNYFFSTASKNIINNSSKNESGSFNNTFSVSDDISVLPNGSSAYSDYAIQDSFSNQSFDSKSSSWVILNINLKNKTIFKNNNNNKKNVIKESNTKPYK